MVICQTPFRVSFFGGGTDYPPWFRQYGGAVISTTINKYGYISCRYLPPFFDYKHRIVYSRIELAKTTADIQHPAVRAVFQHLDVQEGLEIHYDGDIPAQSGIGSSSSFTVGLLNAIYALRGARRSKKALAEEAIHIEQNIIKEAVGSQDQVAAAFGGLNRIDFFPDGKFEVQPLIISGMKSNMLRGRLLLFFTGFSRIAETIAKSQIENFDKKKAQLFRMKEMVDEAQTILQDDAADINQFGKMLDEAWRLKSSLSDKVSTSSIDQIYKAGISAGALGGKILGAGGGGFILFFAPPERHDSIRRSLRNLIEVPFEMDFGGSQVILYNPDREIIRPDWEKTQKVSVG